MIKFKVFPNSNDNFMLSYRYAQILSNQFNISGSYIPTNLPFPAISSSELAIINCSVPENAPSVWFGTENEVNLDKYRNYAFITSHSAKYNKEILSKMINKWEVGPDFPFPIEKIDTNIPKTQSIFLYSLPLPQYMLYESIEAFFISNCNLELKIMAVYYNFKQIKEYISKMRAKYNCNKPISLSCPKSISPDMLINEILQCRYVIDLRNADSISFCSLIAQSVGMPALTTDKTWPQGLFFESPESILKVHDGGPQSGLEIGQYSVQRIADKLDILCDAEDQPILDNSKDIISLFNNIVHNKV